MVDFHQVREKLIVALDFDNCEDALSMARRLKDHVGTFKVGMELNQDVGREALLYALKDMGADVFLDLKLNDIKETVRRTTHKIARAGYADILSVYGYPDTIYAAKDGAGNYPLDIFAITAFTTFDERKLRAAGYTVTMRSLVGQRTDYAVLAGISGVVCAAEDAKTIRAWSRGSLKLLSPGIRLPGGEKHDQVRVSTPGAAVKAGVDYFVVGRPITGNEDPVRAVELVLAHACGETVLN